MALAALAAPTALAATACVAERENLGRMRPDEPVPDAPDCEADPEACEPVCTARMFGTVGAGPHDGAVVEISLADGELRHIASFPGDLGQLRGMTFAEPYAAIYAVSNLADSVQLIQVQVDTGEIRVVAPLRPADAERAPLLFAEAMAFNPCDDELYMVGGNVRAFSDQIVRVDRRTGEVEIVDQLTNAADVDAMVFVGCELYLSDSVSGDQTYLSVTDLDNGGLTLRRNVFGRGFTDLAWDPVSEALYGVSAEDRQVVRLHLTEDTRDEVVGTTHTIEDYNGHGMGGLSIVQECE